MKLKLTSMLAMASLVAISCQPQQEAEVPEGGSASDSSSSDSSASSDSSSSSDSSASSDSSSSSDPIDTPSRDRDRDDDKAEAPSGKGKTAAKAGQGIPMPVFPGLKFGMSLEQLAKLNDKDIDGEYKKKFLTASPTQTLAIEDEVRAKKAVFRRSRIDFLDTPTGIDQSALKGEYSYGNKESLARLSARMREDGKEVPARNFFFFDDKLWKIYEEYKLGAKSNLGADFGQAVAKLTKVFGSAPVKIAADYAKGQSFDEALWADKEKYIRAVDRGDTLGVVFVDKAVQDNLAKYRTRTVTDQHELDKDVKAATANPPSQVMGPPDKDKDKKDAKKK